MMSDCKLMILDEPTASLSDKEANLLFSIIKNLKANGTAVLYVTHRLEEIMALTDRVTVLRNGKLVSLSLIHISASIPGLKQCIWLQTHDLTVNKNIIINDL